jgi:hypothetical protein
LPWDEAIQLPGSGQMQHARTLIESGSYFDRLPDPSLVVPPNGGPPDYVATCRAPDGHYALAYFPSGKPATLRTFILQGPQLHACWYDPRRGEKHSIPPVSVSPWITTTFVPPTAEDWVLILSSAT